jgi:hypothetical protein
MANFLLANDNADELRNTHMAVQADALYILSRCLKKAISTLTV